MQHTYHFDENSMRILISLRLRGKTLKWFHSVSDHLEIPISTLFDNMQRLFGYKPNRLALRREFEKRVWQQSETFPDYYHNKITLSNRFTLDSRELADLIIKGIPDSRLRDQAKMNRFQTADDILDAFQNISLAVDVRGDRRDTNKGRSATVRGGPSMVRKDLRCYNCNETGHLKTDCGKLTRQGGSYTCGNATHQARDCPQNVSIRKPSPQSSTHLLQPSSPDNPFMVPVEFSIADIHGKLFI